MRKRKFYLFLFCLFLFVQIKAQQIYTISGNIKDAKTGEDLIGATIYIKELTIGTITNAYGYYSLSVKAGTCTIVVQYLGYDPQEQQINVSSSLKLDFSLSEQVTQIKDIVVTSRRKDENITQTQMGMQKLDVKEIESIPVLFGEKDVLKTIQLMPGIKSSGEGSSGFNVRGGASDQNLILLDEATVYNASHLLGFFSVFNSDAIKSISVFKGNEPAEYGGRLSSVLDIRMNDGNNQNFWVSGGIGLISSRLAIEGPLVKDKGSFIISGRRTYADMFLKLSNNEDLDGAKLYFYDLNAKGNYRINDNNRVYISGYLGKDKLGFSQFGIDWGNSTGTVRWNHLFSDRVFSNTSIILSNYLYKINLDIGDVMDMNVISRIRDYGIKQDFQLFSKNNSAIKFGFNSTYHKIIPGAITSNGGLNIEDLSNKYAWGNAFYISHQYQLSDKVDIEYGVRLSMFSLLGGGNFYTYDNEGNIQDTATYSTNEFVKTYVNLEPRISVNFLLSEKSSVKASYARNTQNLHLLSNSTSGNPTDLWIPSSNNVKPEIADQASLGYYHNFRKNQYELSIETYYKKLQNQIDYKDGAQLNFNDNVESEILFGDGRAYGFEVYLKKKYGRFNGWISYTLSRTERKLDEINNGNWYPAKQDRTHDISIVGMYDLNKRWSLSASWVYYTGNAVTFPSGKYEIDGKTMYLYTKRNAGRMPAYHRLDLGVTWIRKKTDKFESSWSFSIYNAYGHQNAYTISFRDNEDNPTKTEAVQTSLFRFIPSFTYNFKF
ncbi:TonB-dependent receptor plug domain-containing protein [Maribellus comscasis]|uniref:TonB-dependent receptor plug domain-containing protein n=1 Tax=Maribellus comscasis TaxID=2681766 RepID=A0A6I6K5L4_9BACT|nr:TonB-dependent receptor [Maribellus comscasis]QGY47752.1 TonB-dependent receptor plug domain-containing protein [Maribellus comscasis]